MSTTVHTAEIQTVRSTEGNVDVVDNVTPTDWIDIDVFNPCSSVTPWDYHGGRHQRELCYVLKSAGLSPISLVTLRTHRHPHGTGRNGTVRFGDAMLPGTYRVAVHHTEQSQAVEAIAAHKRAIANWLDNGGPCPDACKL